jgi:NitT/TauT family transport system permease protein
MSVARALRNKWILRAASIALVLCAWQIVGGSINPIFLSTPTAIAGAFVNMVASGELISAVLASLGVTAAGFLLALVVGVPVGLLMGRFRTIEYVLDPYVSALYVVPRIALIPLIIIWAGLGIKAQIVVVFGTTVFPILLSTFAGVRNVDSRLLETAFVFGATERQLFFKVIIPGAVPFIMSGLRLGIGQAIIGMIVAQMFLGIAGMGFLLTNYGNQFATDYVFVVVIALAALGVALTEIVKIAERRFNHWRPDDRQIG